jgi:hypothetical protein
MDRQRPAPPGQVQKQRLEQDQAQRFGKDHDHRTQREPRQNRPAADPAQVGQTKNRRQQLHGKRQSHAGRDSRQERDEGRHEGDGEEGEAKPDPGGQALPFGAEMRQQISVQQVPHDQDRTAGNEKAHPQQRSDQRQQECACSGKRGDRKEALRSGYARLLPRPSSGPG